MVMIVLMEVLLMAMLMITAMQVGPGDGYVLTVGGFNYALSTLGDSILHRGGNANGMKFSTKWVLNKVPKHTMTNFSNCPGTWTRITVILTVLTCEGGVGGITLAIGPTRPAQALQPKQVVGSMWFTTMGEREVLVQIVLKKQSFCLSRNKMNWIEIRL